LEGVGDIEGVARAKAELFGRLPRDGDAVYPSGEPLLLPYVKNILPMHRHTFGTDDADLVQVKAVNPTREGTEATLRFSSEDFALTLPLPGAHNVRNAAAAAAVGLILGATPKKIVAQLAGLPSLVHRSTLIELGPFKILDDSYNANPVAMCAALDTLCGLAGDQPSIAVLGAMAELGARSEAYHHQVGAHAAQLPLSALIVIGEARPIAEGARQAGMSPKKIFVVENQQLAAAAICAQSRGADQAWILLKGARRSRLEDVLSELRALQSTD
jgi:UDP-N-acetylmuramoyl-tripeptide--D-alanyl-D-alanine ligase